MVNLRFQLRRIIIFFLAVGGAVAQEAAVPATSSAPKAAAELAMQAASEKLPQVSASILRTQLQQEKKS